MEYRCVATSVEGFVQQLAVAYITHGYWFYVTGVIPDGKDPAAVDAKLIDRYGVAISKWARCRRKKQGLANMQYLRHERFFVLLATKGRHEFFERERATLLDVRRVPITFGSCSVGCRKGRDGRWHASVRIESNRLADLKAAALEVSGRSASRFLEKEFRRLSVQPYAPIRQQRLEIWRIVNRARRKSGLVCLPVSAIALKRRVVRPFAQTDTEPTETGTERFGV